MNELEPETASQQWLWFGLTLFAMSLIAWVTTAF